MMTTRRKFFGFFLAIPFMKLAASAKPGPVFGLSKIDELWKAGLLTRRQTHFARGGLVEGMNMLVGERSPEMILPRGVADRLRDDQNLVILPQFYGADITVTNNRPVD
jgi:hypothetical protein